MMYSDTLGLTPANCKEWSVPCGVLSSLGLMVAVKTELSQGVLFKRSTTSRPFDNDMNHIIASIYIKSPFAPYLRSYVMMLMMSRSAQIKRTSACV